MDESQEKCQEQDIFYPEIKRKRMHKNKKENKEKKCLKKIIQILILILILNQVNKCRCYALHNTWKIQYMSNGYSCNTEK